MINFVVCTVIVVCLVIGIARNAERGGCLATILVVGAAIGLYVVIGVAPHIDLAGRSSRSARRRRSVRWSSGTLFR